MDRVLVVDDACFMRKVLRDILVENNYEVVGYGSNGLEGYNEYKKLKPDIVLMDITMPDVNGVEGLKRIIDYDSNAKVVMCSAMGQQSLIIDCLKLGAVDFVVKPFSSHELIDALSKI